MLERFSALVQQIYEGCTDPLAWTRIVAELSDYLEADKGLLLTPFDAPDQGGFVFPHGISQANLALWETRYLPEDLWARRVGERGLMQQGNVILSKDIVTDEEFLQSPWYREFLSRMDIFHLATGIVFPAGHAFPFTTCSFFRGVDSPAFEESHRTKLQPLVPHLSRALEVMIKLRDAEFRVAASLHALNGIRQGVLLLDEQGAVCFANIAAETILRQQDGLQLGEKMGAHHMLKADDPIAARLLQGALRSGVNAFETEPTHVAQTILIRRPSGSTSYAVQISHLPDSNPYRAGSVTPRAVVFIKDASLSSPPEPRLLQKVYGLTQAETRAALALCDGGSLDAVAAQLNVKPNTLKTHLKGIYLKTSVNNRAALTKLMLSLANDVPVQGEETS